MKRLVFLSLLLFTFSEAQAQYRFDYGITLGAMNYLGDIGGLDQPRRDFINDIKITETRYSIGGYYRAQFSRTLSVSAAYIQGRIEGWDANSIYAARRGRNLNFRNEIKELSLRGEFALFADNDVGGKGHYNPDFKLYAFAGIAGFYHNPKGKYQGEWYSLRPLKTEGQAKEYSKVAFAIPMGFGFYFTHLRKHRFSWEFGYRNTFTDYIDDISTTYAYESELDGELAINLANQSSEQHVAETNAEYLAEVNNPTNLPSYYDYAYSPGQIEQGQRNQRGIDSNNDGYMFMSVGYGRVLPSNSRFAKKFSKQARYKSRFRKNRRISKSKKSRAKF